MRRIRSGDCSLASPSSARFLFYFANVRRPFLVSFNAQTTIANPLGVFIAKGTRHSFFFACLLSPEVEGFSTSPARAAEHA